MGNCTGVCGGAKENDPHIANVNQDEKNQMDKALQCNELSPNPQNLSISKFAEHQLANTIKTKNNQNSFTNNMKDS